MLETPTQEHLTQFDIEQSLIPEKERNTFDLERDDQIDPSLWNIPGLQSDALHFAASSINKKEDINQMTTREITTYINGMTGNIISARARLMSSGKTDRLAA